MKICKYCGTEYADTQLKCPGCGANKVLTEAEIAEENMLQEREGSGSDFGPNPGFEDENGKLKKVLIICGVVLAVIVLIVIISLSSNNSGSTKVSNDEYKASYEAGVAFLSQGEYEEAISKLAFVSSDSKYYDGAQIPLEEAKAKYREDILKKVDSYLENDAYDVALGMLTEALKVLPNDDTLSLKHKEIENRYKEKIKEESINSANNSAANEDYDSAIDTISKAILEIGNDEELQSLLDTYKKKYVEITLKQVANTYEESGYDSVVSLLKRAVDVVPDNQELTSEYNLWLSRTDMILNEENSFSKSTSIWFDQIYDNKDNYDNSYSNCFAAHDSGTLYVEYYLDKNYSELTGTIYVNNEARTINPSYYTWDVANISIYGDGKLLYSKTGFSTKEKPTDVHIDVTGVDFLRIEITDAIYYDYGADALVGLGNFMVGW